MLKRKGLPYLIGQGSELLRPSTMDEGVANAQKQQVTIITTRYLTVKVAECVQIEILRYVHIYTFLYSTLHGVAQFFSHGEWLASCGEIRFLGPVGQSPLFSDGGHVTTVL